MHHPIENGGIETACWFPLVLMSLRNRLYNLEEFRKVCVHGSGKDSGGKGTITNIFFLSHFFMQVQIMVSY
jgi:hypothetical protein